MMDKTTLEILESQSQLISILMERIENLERQVEHQGWRLSNLID